MKKSVAVLEFFFVFLLASLHGQTQATAGAQAPSTAKPGISFKENEEIPEELSIRSNRNPRPGKRGSKREIFF
jgi:hypothetical protein